MIIISTIQEIAEENTKRTAKYLYSYRINKPVIQILKKNNQVIAAYKSIQEATQKANQKFLYQRYRWAFIPLEKYQQYIQKQLSLQELLNFEEKYSLTFN